MQSTTEQLGNAGKKALDGAASIIPGQEKTRDHFTDNAATPSLTHDHGRAGGMSGAKPAGEMTMGETIKEKADQSVLLLPSPLIRSRRTPRYRVVG
jgi:hypothetical protein